MTPRHIYSNTWTLLSGLGRLAVGELVDVLGGSGHTPVTPLLGRSGLTAAREARGRAGAWRGLRDVEYFVALLILICQR